MTEWNLDDYKTVTWGSLVVNWNFLNGRLISKCHLTCNDIDGIEIKHSVKCIFYGTHLRVEVQHHELGLLCPVPGAHSAHELGGAGADPPDHAPRAPGVQGDQVPDKLT